MSQRQPIRCPAITGDQVRALVEDGRLLIEDGIVSQLCRSCDTAWPYDTEFFPPHPNQMHGIDVHCRCCRNEQFREIKRRARAAANLRPGLAQRLNQLADKATGEHAS